MHLVVHAVCRRRHEPKYYELILRIIRVCAVVLSHDQIVDTNTHFDLLKNKKITTVTDLLQYTPVAVQGIAAACVTE